MEGGGIYAYKQYEDIVSSVEYCMVKSCTASSGGGIFSRSLINNCLVSNCSASTFGGGIYSSYPKIYNCSINNCSATSGAGIYSFGNSIFLYSVANCAISNCLASDSGGGIFFSGNSSATNCSISNNGSSNIVGGTQVSVISPNIYITFLKPTSFIGIATSDAQKAELLFANWELREKSPCINAGVFIKYPYDLLGNPRFLYGNQDIGAYEFEISTILLPFIEDFNSLIDFETSSKIFNTTKINNINDLKWTIENRKVVFNWKANLTKTYTNAFYTYQIDAIKASKVFLKYDMYFEAYAGSINPLGTESLRVEYSTNFLNWEEIVRYSNQNGTIPNKTYLYDISNSLAGKTFYLRFNAKGENTNRIEKWEIDNIIVDVDGKTTDIKQIKEASFLYSVNNGVLDIQNLKETTKVQLFDVNGKLLNEYKPVSNSIKLALPVHGIYIVRTESESGIESKKVVW